MKHFAKRRQPFRYPQRAAAIFLAFACLINLLPLNAARAESTGTLSARVVLRKAADKESKALQTLAEGEEVTVLETADSWYRVRYGTYSGYIMKKYVTVAKNSVTANEEKIQALGDAPGALRIGDEGNDVKKLQKALAILGYYDLGVDGKYGNGTTTAVALFQQAASLEPDGVAGKGTITAIFGDCADQTDITVEGENTTGNKRSLKNKTVKASSTTVSDTSSTTSTTTATGSSTASSSKVTSISDIGTAPAACKEGSSGSDVKKLQQALTLLGYYSGDIDGDYGAKTVAAVKRFQKNRGMTEDGIAGASTIRVLFGTSKTTATTSSSSSSDKTYTTEVLDWFDDNVTSVIPKKAKFTVKDVRSGKTFTAIRWSGVNHLDAEPATAEDTAMLKKIYGGAWSWNRRAILILYRGHVYAASMNGMPHGTSTIDSNDFEGHFCIHFKNSKTHGTVKVDAGHQAAVTAASKATW